MSNRDVWREQILSDFPKLRQIPSVVDNLLDVYESDPDGFRSAVKAATRKDRKKQRVPAPYDPDKFILTCINKVESK